MEHELISPVKRRQLFLDDGAVETKTGVHQTESLALDIVSHFRSKTSRITNAA